MRGVYVEWKDGRGWVAQWLSVGRTKKICAIVVCRKKIHVVPIGDLRVVRAPKKC